MILLSVLINFCMFLMKLVSVSYEICSVYYGTQFCFLRNLCVFLVKLVSVYYGANVCFLQNLCLFLVNLGTASYNCCGCFFWDSRVFFFLSLFSTCVCLWKNCISIWTYFCFVSDLYNLYFRLKFASAYETWVRFKWNACLFLIRSVWFFCK